MALPDWLGPLAIVPTAFAALMPVVNPFGTALIILGMVGNHPEEVYRRLAAKVALLMLAYVAVVILVGQWLLHFFGISLPAFRIARLGHAAHRLRIDLDQPAGPPLREAALRHQTEHSLPAGCGPDQFFPRRSFSAETSSIDSASSFFSRRFSSSSVFSFCASDMLMPLYLAFQR